MKVFLLQRVSFLHQPHGGSTERITMVLCLLRYLIPCSHLSRKQHCSLKQRDCYSSNAASFLLLMPSWCPVYLHNTNTCSEHIHWPKGAGQYIKTLKKIIIIIFTDFNSVCVRSVGVRQCWLLSGFGLPDGCELRSVPLGRSPGYRHLTQVCVPDLFKDITGDKLC